MQLLIRAGGTSLARAAVPCPFFVVASASNFGGLPSRPTWHLSLNGASSERIVAARGDLGLGRRGIDGETGLRLESVGHVM